MSANSFQSDSVSDLDSDPIIDKIEKILEMQMRFELVTEDLFTKMIERLDALDAQIQGTAPPAEEEDGPMNWESQKKAMFAEYGDGSFPASEEPQAKASPVEETVESEGSLDANLEESPQSPQLTSNTADLVLSDSDRLDVENLKNELREKLRQAEMELSIGRAKISQERAELDNQRSELDRLAKKFESFDGTSAPKKQSILERLARHMQGSQKTDEN